ncbi:CBS and ACT domain-containing protein [Neomoorella thermoacetica]|uniref:Inosine-5'-monophosphate dehydrogenase n=3 Tax=Neomoorella thermoacetica TaxID=1525 RepID=A0A1D7XAE6_NEOTH|nr:CBS and ACT domain-containing protein [Moorella thermoacetica]AKX93900.1 inosine-5'-monophosphate dehydrogenase [Moorella thermoacetica]AKX96541.1 inosine-5'-monophosphate dehydrogenase [Moorella thermoacetica]AOQ23836.1 Inosine-5'-monophosphate dehydrogenase [Moorella thermoacetica]APC08293.1 inosine-5'-monophosphate dehydrogenase [Moorella thermoacetica]OIQ08917.1 inosine-5'-monophosphate dehydrogenase [Moorella thermoacetica]
MFVRDHMTPDPITVTKETSVLDALELMKKNKIRRLPVIQDGRLIGLVTERDILRVSPSPASTLSVFEVNYLVAKMTVKDAMIKRPVTVPPDMTIEEAALLMREHKIDNLLVMEKERLVGIITQTDLFEALIKLFGLRRPGIRLTLKVVDRIGVLADIARLVKEAGINIINVANRHKDDIYTYVVLRLATDDVSSLLPALEDRGYQVVHVSSYNG